MATVTTSNSGKPNTSPIVTSTTPGMVDAPITPAAVAAGQLIEPQRRHAMICDAAYFLSERRGFCPGQEIDDWLSAEAEIDRALPSGDTAPGSGR